jgi:hypothetical protein
MPFFLAGSLLPNSELLISQDRLVGESALASASSRVMTRRCRAEQVLLEGLRSRGQRLLHRVLDA